MDGFHAQLVSCVEVTVQPGRRRLNDCLLLVDEKLLEVPVNFLEGDSIYLSEAKLQVRKPLSFRYPADFEESEAKAPEKMASIDVLAGDLEGEGDWDLAYLTGGPDLSSRAAICEDYERLREACFLVNNSIPSSMSDLLSLGIRSVEVMRRASILEVLFGALNSTFSSNNWWIGNWSHNLYPKVGVRPGYGEARGT